MTHPASVSRLPGECVLVEEDFTINYTAAGRCLYKPYLGVAYRDKGLTLEAWMVLCNQVFSWGVNLYEVFKQCYEYESHAL